MCPRSLMAGPGSEECGSEEQLGPGEIGQFFLHGCANRLPRAAHDPLIYGGERPHNCGSELREPPGRVAGNLLRGASTTAAKANPAMTCSRNSQPIAGIDRYPVRCRYRWM